MPIHAFFEETSIDGLCYIRKGKPKLIQIFWIAVFIFGIGATGKSVYTAIHSFMSGPTATETKMETKTSMALPRIAVCTSNRFNGSKVRSLNISDDLVAVLNQDFLFMANSLLPAMTAESDFKELLNHTRPEYLQLMNDLNFTDHGQLLDTLFSSCPDVIKDCRNSRGSPITCCETEPVFASVFGICAFLPQFIQANEFGGGLVVHLKFPTEAEITPARNFDLSEDLVVYLSLSDKYSDILTTGYNYVARGSHTSLVLNKVSYEAVNNPPEYILQKTN